MTLVASSANGRHVEWVDFHWIALAERLRRPEPPPAKTPPGEGMDTYVSSLYDNLGAEDDDVKRH